MFQREIVGDCSIAYDNSLIPVSGITITPFVSNAYTRTLMVHMHIPKYLWADAVRDASPFC